jgi:hypothetical protein
MFEVIIKKSDDTTETYDCLTDHQAEFIFFRAKSDAMTDVVILNEIIDVADATSN